MDYLAAFRISTDGLNLEKLRLETAAVNLANMNSTTGPDGRSFRPLRVVAQSTAQRFEDVMNSQSEEVGVIGTVVEDDSAVPRIVHDPGHPHADSQGNVHYPGVDHATEMLNVMTAMRAYQANVVALSAARSMAVRALEIGGQS